MPVVVDSLRRTNAVYRVTSREFSYNGSTRYRPKFKFQNAFYAIKGFFLNYKKAKETRIYPLELFEGIQESF